MKIYNINNTCNFFKKLASCQGEVEFVDGRNGSRTPLTKQGIQENLLPLSLINGEISEIELIFHNHQDFDSIFRWVMNKGSIAC